MKLLFVCVLTLLVGAPVALGDWDPDDGHKMHFPQMPDPFGWDVGFVDTMMMIPLELADDWQCSQTGPVEDIHFWISWYYDMEDVIGPTMVSIYSNDPCGPGGWSQPDELLWQQMFPSLNYIYYGDGLQGWYDPSIGMYEPDNHLGIYQINITDIAEPFIQEEGQIYWLGIQTDTWYVGWKTSLDHFEDDAAWRLPGDPQWYELYDPLSGESLDFAFVITGGPEEPPDNDDCDNAEPVGDVTDLPFDTTTATFDGSGTCMTSPNIWYCYTATCTGVVTVSLCGSSYDTMLAVYDGCTCDPLGTELGCNDDYCGLQSQISFAATAGNEYLIEVGGFSSSTGQGLLSINCEPLEAGIKWSQPPVPYDPCFMPDVYMGWDEESDEWLPNVLDDFRCDTDLPVNHIRWWGSYLDYYDVDVPVQDMDFYITFWTDVPADPCGPSGNCCYVHPWPGCDDPVCEASVCSYDPFCCDPCGMWDDLCAGEAQNDPCCNCGEPSHPGELIHEIYCDNYTVDFYGWEWNPYDPCATMMTKFEFNQVLDPCDWWYQPGDSGIYWLGIMAIYNDEPAYLWGWETRPHFFQDDAVRLWADPRIEPPPYQFEPIEGPDGETWDMSFELFSEEVPEPKEPVPNLKWSQPPIEYDPTEPEPRYCGWDEISFTDDPNQWWRIAADDFRCFGSMPIDSIHWWGSHWQWDGDEPPPGDPPIAAWRIGFWSNEPAHPNNPWSHPEMLLWQIEVDAARVPVERVGVDDHPINEGFLETCFQYYVDLEPDEVFWQEEFLQDTQDDVFWISIAAVYPEDAFFEYPWGWKTRPWSWMDDGVSFELIENPQPGMVIDPCDPSINMYPLEYLGESYDLAFELDTDPNWIKWDQPFTGIRHWPHYEDVLSWAEVWDEVPFHLQVAADDWQCQGPLPVTALAWWGSYLGYQYHPCSIDPDPPKQLMAPPEQPAYFDITIWTDVPDPNVYDPSNWSHPDEPVWQYRAYDYDEVLVGYDKHPHDGIPSAAEGAEIRKRAMSEPVNVPAGPQMTNSGEEKSVVFTGHVLTTSSGKSAGCSSILYAPTQNDDATFRAAVSTACGGATVDYYDARVGTPTVATLSNYDCVFTWVDAAYADKVAFGDNLADYVDAGGKVILGQWCYPSDQLFSLGGRIMTAAYCPVTTSTSYNSGNYAGDGTDCVHNGVTAYGTTYLDDATLQPGCSSDGTFTPGGEISVSWRPDRMVYYSAGNTGMYHGTGDWAQLTCNMCCCDAPSVGNEPVFRYTARIPEEDWFWQDPNDSVYWLSIVAVYLDHYPEYEWGWTNHQHVYNDDAVQANLDDPFKQQWPWFPIYDQTGASADLSFTIYTDPYACRTCADFDDNGTIDLNDLRILAANWLWTGTPGGYNIADLNCDGKVDNEDFAIFALQWLDSCP